MQANIQICIWSDLEQHMNTDFQYLRLWCIFGQVPSTEAILLHWEKELVRLTCWLKWSYGRPRFTCVPITVQMFIQSGMAIAGQIETDFLKTLNSFDIWPLPREAGEWVQVHSMNQAERSFRVYFPIYTQVP